MMRTALLTHLLDKAFFSALLFLVVPVVHSEVCDYSNDGTSFNLHEDGNCTIIVLDPLFYNMLEGTSQSINVLLENDESIFHEGPVLFEEDAELYFTTKRLENTSVGPTWGLTAPAQLDQYIDIYKLDLTTKNLTVLKTNPEIVMANGMTKTADGLNILALSQGFNNADGVDGAAGGVLLLDRKTLEVTPIVQSFYGYPFNSLNDIKTTSDNILFLSDPPYGFEQGFRLGDPALGANVYRYDSNTKELQVLTTALQRPNGVALLDDRAQGNGCTLFLTDTGFEATAQKPRGFEGWGDSSLYYMQDDSDTCFEPSAGPFTLQALAVVGKGIQDGINVHATTKTLLYCDGDGLWVWSIPLRRPLGMIREGCTQLQFPQKTGIQTIYMLAETKLSTIQLNFDETAMAAVPLTFDEGEASNETPTTTSTTSSPNTGNGNERAPPASSSTVASLACCLLFATVVTIVAVLQQH